MENAVKYSPPDAPIEVATGRENGYLVLSVRDYGPGVPAELQDKIFDRFFRVDNRLTREVGGTGLGLAICKGFVEAHHGRVWVKAAEPGATFGFHLPVVKNEQEDSRR
jgi:signal transduction histidine kinase